MQEGSVVSLVPCPHVACGSFDDSFSLDNWRHLLLIRDMLSLGGLLPVRSCRMKPTKCRSFRSQVVCRLLARGWIDWDLCLQQKVRAYFSGIE